MARVHHFVIGMLILQIHANAAPSDISKLEDIATIEQTDPKLDSEPHPLKEAKTDDNSTQGVRQKRFYDYYGFGLPPINPLLYPNNFKRDESRQTGAYGAEDPLVQIQRRLQEIADAVRQPITPPPPPNPIPIVFPVLFLPQTGCGCDKTPSNTPQTPTLPGNQTVPDIDNRTPPIANETNDDDEEDFSSRPISFVPIKINKAMKRPPPPVEHGSSQGDSNTQAASTVQPGERLPPSTSSPESSLPVIPSACDGAVLSCCHQLEVTYDCFALQGCPDPTTFNNPCSPNAILNVINKFQRFYGKKNG